MIVLGFGRISTWYLGPRLCLSRRRREFYQVRILFHSQSRVRERTEGGTMHCVRVGRPARVDCRAVASAFGHMRMWSRDRAACDNPCLPHRTTSAACRSFAASIPATPTAWPVTLMGLSGLNAGLNTGMQVRRRRTQRSAGQRTLHGAQAQHLTRTHGQQGGQSVTCRFVTCH